LYEDPTSHPSALNTQQSTPSAQRGCPQSGRSPNGPQPRYRLLETIRQHGWGDPRESEAAAGVYRRNADWFLALAEEAESQLMAPEQLSWLDRLEEEHDNRRTALDWYCSDPNGGEEALRRAGALWRFWECRGCPAESRGHLERALKCGGEG